MQFNWTKNLRFGLLALGLTLGGLALAPAMALAGDEAAFVPGTEDIPLMAGLTVVGEGAMVFDSLGGRIVEVYATGPFDRAAVLGFYRQTLPQLGWVRRAQGRHQREDEILRIDFPAPDAATPSTTHLTVRFTLKPKSAK